MALLGKPQLLSHQQNCEEERTNKAEANGSRNQALWSGVDLFHHKVGGGIAISDWIVGAVGVRQHDVCPHKHGGHWEILWQLPAVLLAGSGGGWGKLLHDQPGALLIFLHMSNRPSDPAS